MKIIDEKGKYEMRNGKIALIYHKVRPWLWRGQIEEEFIRANPNKLKGIFLGSTQNWNENGRLNDFSEHDFDIVKKYHN